LGILNDLKLLYVLFKDRLNKLKYKKSKIISIMNKKREENLTFYFKNDFFDEIKNDKESSVLN
jgi:hypothetical protein